MRNAFKALALACLLPALASCSLLRSGSGTASLNNSAPNAQPSSNSDSPRLPPLPPDADARAHIERGIEAYKKNFDEEAAAAFEQAIRLDPASAEAHYRLGLAYSALGRSEDAKKSFETAVKEFRKVANEEEENSDAQYYLGLSYAKLGEWEDAVRAFKQAVRDEPNDTDKYYELGIAHSKLAQYREAVNALEKSLEIDENNFRAADALERAREGLERREAILRELEKMKRQKGNTNVNANVSHTSNSATSPPASTPRRP